MRIKYIISFLVLLLIILIAYVLVIYNIYGTDFITDEKNIRKKMLYSDLKPYFKSGDLIFFSFINASILTRSWINSRFPHVGMVIKYNDELFIIELVDDDDIKPRDKRHRGVLLNPLFERISEYAGSVYYSSLKSKLSAKNEKILKDYAANREVYNYTDTSQIIYSLLTFSKKLDKNNRFCTEYIAELLDALEISSKPINSSKIALPSEIFNLANGSVYTDPLHILCDNLMIKNLSDGNPTTYC